VDDSPIPRSTLAPFHASGTYSDRSGESQILWSISPHIDGSQPAPRFEIRTTIRGVNFAGFDFDSLEPSSAAAAGDALLELSHGDLTDCVLTGVLPCALEIDGEIVASSVEFELDLRNGETLRVACGVGDSIYEASGQGWFEDVLLQLQETFPSEVLLASCLTCSLSDYSPGGNGLTGMRCHRSDAEQYLAVRSKADYWPVPVTELVMETHRCDQWRRRVPGTGCRG
jgi:Family of unknown function (DUF6304)